MKCFLIILFIQVIFSCNQKITTPPPSIKDIVKELVEPTCSTISEFGGFSRIYTDECGCGAANGFFGTYWNIYCDNEIAKQKIKHVNYIGDIKKWNLVIDFLKSRPEDEAKKLLELTNLILLSSKDTINPFMYYDNIKKGNDFLNNNVQSESFKAAFTNFYNNVFKI